MQSLITMTEIARIAGVTRQAVTNWRRRPAAASFPTAIDVAQGAERFDLDQVLDWLDKTGRGRDGDARLDAPSVAVPEDLDLARAVVMLALRAGVSQDLAVLTPAERVALAKKMDPEDRYLLAEVRRVANDDSLAAYVDELLSASFGPDDALDRLYAGRAAQGTRGLTAEMIDLLKELAGACRAHLGPDDVAIDLRLDPRARRVADGFDVFYASDDRSAMRYHALDGRTVGRPGAPLVRVISAIGLDDAQALNLAGEVAVDLDTNQVAIILGSASALCDRLQGDLYATRKSALAMGAETYGCALAAAFRLPRGLWREAHRQSVGVWVLEGATTSGGVVVADLCGTEIEEVELAADTLGALERSRARSYRYGRVVPYNDVWTREVVVVPGIGAVQVPKEGLGASAHDRLVEATLVTQEPVSGFDLAELRRGTPVPAVTRSLGELIDAGDVSLRSGSRIAAEDLDPSASVRVLSMMSAENESAMDPFVAADRYSYAARTEPGDIVFSNSPKPWAMVDDVGGSLVASPNRILRLHSRASIGPRALAAAINELATSSEWKTWPVPNVPVAQIQVLEDYLRGVLDHLATLLRHEEAATSIITNLIQGVAEGSVALGSSATERKAG